MLEDYIPSQCVAQHMCRHLHPGSQLPDLRPRVSKVLRWDGFSRVDVTNDARTSVLQAACMLDLTVQNSPEQLLACSLQVHFQLFLACHIRGTDEHGWKSVDGVLQNIGYFFSQFHPFCSLMSR